MRIFCNDKYNKILITVLGVSFFVFAGTQLYYFICLIKYDGYVKFFHTMPPWLAEMRYFFSLFLRVIICIAGIGLITRKEIYRKITLGIFTFNLIFVHWKHPIQAFYQSFTNVPMRAFIDAPLSEHSDIILPRCLIMKMSLILGNDIISSAWIAKICFSLLDIGVSLLVIFIFTRPTIKHLFK